MANRGKLKQVISASRRTDIPSFYLNGFIEAIQQGWIEVANPFYPQKVKRVSLRPEDVAWIVFWSRNYAHFLRKRSYFEAYQLFFHFTILSPSVLEKRPMDIAKQLDQMEQLAGYYGPERIIWRYDPLVFWEDNGMVNTNFKLDEFKQMAKRIGGFGVKRCYTSIAFPYAKFKSRLAQKFPTFRLLDKPNSFALKIVKEMVAIARDAGIQIYACCTDVLLTIDGVKKGHCIDGHLLNQLHPQEKVSVAKAPTRPQCGCTSSIDIGDYRKQPCYTGCIYCYANPVWK